MSPPKQDDRPILTRLAQIDVTAISPAEAASTYERNFGFRIRNSSAAGAAITIGDAEIRLTPCSSSDSHEGLAALWFETNDLNQLAEALERAGIQVGPIQIRDGRRALAIDARHTYGVPLFIVNSKE